jgi:hypothetical protein
VEGDGFEPNRLGHLYFRGRYSSSQTSSIRQLTSGRPLGRIPDAQEQPPGDRPHQIPRSANGNTQVQCDPADGGTPKASGRRCPAPPVSLGRIHDIRPAKGADPVSIT